MQILKGLFYYGAILLIVVVVTPYTWSFFSRLTKGQLVEVEVATAVNGRVMKCDVNNHNFLWYLNDQEARYDFEAFDGGDAFTRTEQAKMPAQNGTGLQYYLEIGDAVQKAANSPTLVVKRGATVTTWTYATGEDSAHAPSQR